MSTNTKTLDELLGAEYIDSRDVIERIEELENTPCAHDDDFEDGSIPRGAYTDDDGDVLTLGDLTHEQLEYVAGRLVQVPGAPEPLYREEADELIRLRAFAEEASQYAEDWLHGTTLIADEEFVSYAEETAYDIGAVDRNATWPLSFIDWEAAADALKQDYTQVEFEGSSWWVR